MTTKAVTPSGSNDGNGNGGNGKSPTFSLGPEDDGRRQKRQRRGVLAWQKELRATKISINEIDWLLSAWLRGLLSSAELDHRVEDLLEQTNMTEWSFHVGMLVGSLSTHLQHKPDERLSELVQLMAVLRGIRGVVWDSGDGELLEELRLSLTGVHRALLDEEASSSSLYREATR